MAHLLLLPSPPDDGIAEHHASFIEPAPLIDVLFDQLEYLVSHAEQECPPQCPDCKRLEQVKRLLLVPFSSPDTPEAPEPVAA
jgi:hypothetical protein